MLSPNITDFRFIIQTQSIVAINKQMLRFTSKK